MTEKEKLQLQKLEELADDVTDRVSKQQLQQSLIIVLYNSSLKEIRQVPATVMLHITGLQNYKLPLLFYL